MSSLKSYSSREPEVGLPQRFFGFLGGIFQSDHPVKTRESLKIYHSHFSQILLSEQTAASMIDVRTEVTPVFLVRDLC